MKQTVTVIYPTGSWASRGEAPYLSEPERHKLEIEVEDNTPTCEKLELVFRMMNRVDGSPIEAQHAAMKVRSMCAGDMVEMDGLTFICEGMGYKYLLPSLGYVNVPPEGVVKARA
jgi:hypothetical protein